MMNYFMNITMNFIMKSTVQIVFLIIFLGGAYYTGRMMESDNNRDIIKGYDAKIDSLNLEMHNVQKENIQYRDSVRILKDSLGHIGIDKLKMGGDGQKK